MRYGMIGAALAAGLLVPTAVLAQAQPRPRPATAAPRPAAPATAARPAAQPLQVPAAPTLLVLIKSTLLAFNHANQTNIYHVFYGLGSDSFRRANTPDGLSRSFTAFRTNNVDLGTVVNLNPQLTAQPAIVQNRLRLTGFFPTTPRRVTFDMVFEPSQGRWKMAQLNVGLQAVAQGQAAPRPQAPAQPPRRQR